MEVSGRSGGRRDDGSDDRWKFGIPWDANKEEMWEEWKGNPH